MEQETRRFKTPARFLFRVRPFCSESLFVAATRIIAGLVLISRFVMMRVGIVRLFVRIFSRAVIMPIIMIILADFDADSDRFTRQPYPVQHRRRAMDRIGHFYSQLFGDFSPAPFFIVA